MDEPAAKSDLDELLTHTTAGFEAAFLGQPIIILLRKGQRYPHVVYSRGAFPDVFLAEQVADALFATLSRETYTELQRILAVR